MGMLPAQTMLLYVSVATTLTPTTGKLTSNHMRIQICAFIHFPIHTVIMKFTSTVHHHFSFHSLT